MTHGNDSGQHQAAQKRVAVVRAFEGEASTFICKEPKSRAGDCEWQQPGDWATIERHY